MKKTYLILSLLFAPLIASAQAGSPDATFGTDGVATTAVHEVYNFAKSTLVQEDGKILVAGNSGLPSTYSMTVARFNEDGSLDTGFADEGHLRFQVGPMKSFVMDMVQQPDGKIVLGGYTWDNVQGDYALVRLLEDGSFDSTFGEDGIMLLETSTSDTGEALALLDDGKILMGGYKNNQFTVARFNSDGSLDTTFGIDGWSTIPFENAESFVRAIAVQNDGKIVLSGFLLNNSNFYQVCASRLHADGSIDTEFGTGGKVVFNVGNGNDFSEALAIQEDGKLLIGGHKWIANAQQRHDLFVARLNSDGSLDTTYGENGVATARLVDGANYSRDLVLQSDQKVVLGGYTAFQSDYEMALVRFTTDGILDSTFGESNDGMVSYSLDGRETYTESLAIQADEKVIMVGHAYDTRGDSADMVVVRFNSDATMATEDMQYVEMTLYPNPVQDVLHIKTEGNADAYTYEVFDLLGKRVMPTMALRNNALDVSGLSTGTYLLKITGAQSSRVIKVVKN